MKNWKFCFFLTFKESLFEINHSLIFSLFIVEKWTLMSLCSKNRFVLSESIIVFNKLEVLGRSFTYTKNSSGPRVDPCGTPHVTFLFSSLAALINPNVLFPICFVSSKPGEICSRNSIDLKLFQKYCMIDCIKHLQQVDKNANCVVAVLKLFVDLIYKLSNCMFCRVASW